MPSSFFKVMLVTYVNHKIEYMSDQFNVCQYVYKNQDKPMYLSMTSLFKDYRNAGTEKN